MEIFILFLPPGGGGRDSQPGHPRRSSCWDPVHRATRPAQLSGRLVEAAEQETERRVGPPGFHLDQRECRPVGPAGRKADLAAQTSDAYPWRRGYWKTQPATAPPARTVLR